MPSEVIVVPNLAVRPYAEEPVEQLRRAGYDVDLRPGLCQQGVPVDVADCPLEAEFEASEDVLDEVSADLATVHGEYGHLTTYAYAAAPAAGLGPTAPMVPNGAETGRTPDPDGFLALVDDLVDVLR